MRRYLNKKILSVDIFSTLILLFILLATLGVPIPSFSQSSSLTIGNYSLVSQQRAGRTTYDYIFRASITNNGLWNVENVTATLTSRASSTTVIAGALTFGYVIAGATVPSQNTFTVRIDRSSSFNQSDLNWNIQASFNQKPVQFSPGIHTDITTQTIGPAGGVIRVTNSGTPLDGVTVAFPAGAIPDNVSVSLGYSNGTLIPNSGMFSGTVITLNVPDVYEFNQPATITVPFSPDANTVPVPYYIDSNGKLHPVQLVSIDRQSGLFMFQTFHASFFTWIFGIKTVYAPGPNDIANTGYLPANDGFQIINNGSKYYRDGECFGMTSFSLWYFMNKKDNMGDLYPKYYGIVDYSEGEPVRGQNIIATRAFTSISEKWNDYYRGLVNQQNSLSASDNYAAIRNAIINTGNPVLIGLYHSDNSDGAHSVLAYAFNYLNGTLSIYDPNFPGEIRAIYYNSSRNSFESYSSGIYSYDDILYSGDGSLRLTESYQSILGNAEANFHGSSNAIISITSHTSGQQVTNSTVNLVGTIESGAILITKIRVYVGSTPFAAEVGLDGHFNIPINLVTGNNYIQFQTLGPQCLPDIEDPTVEICYPLAVQNNMLTDFILKYVLPPPPPPQGPWLSFVEGNPGIPGDGVLISSTTPGCLFNFATPILASDQFTNGLTITVFPVFPANDIEISLGFAATDMNTGCGIGSTHILHSEIRPSLVRGVPVVLNGIQGWYVNMGPFTAQAALDYINLLNSFVDNGQLPAWCRASSTDKVGISRLGLSGYTGPPPSQPHCDVSLDAAAILPGQNTIPNGVVVLSPATLLIDGGTSSSKQQGGTFSVSGSGYTPYGTVTRHLKRPSGAEDSPQTITADGNGNVSWTWSSTCSSTLTTYTIWAVDDVTQKTSNNVTEIITSNPGCNVALTISQINPATVTKNQQVTFTLTGTGFQSGFTAQYINERNEVWTIPSTQTQYLSPTTVTITWFIGPGPTSLQTIKIINPDGQSAQINFTALTSVSLISWDFNTNGNFQGWTLSNMSSISVNAGILYMDPAGPDPYLSSPNISASASDYRYVQLSMASNAPDGSGAIYFRTQTENAYAEDKRVNFTVVNCPLCGNAGYYIYTTDMWVHPKWTGTITGIRIDPAINGQSGTALDTIGIDYIKITP